jgi:UPF0755 protein
LVLAKKIIVSIFGVVVVAAAALAIFLYAGLTRAPRSDASGPVRLTITKGEAFASVVDKLAGEGFLTSTWAVKAYASLRGLDRKIKSGTYELNAGERPLDILLRLVEGDVLTTTVTIPEGYATWDIAGAFQAAGVDSTAMLSALQDAGTRERRRISASSLEGYLFPDTYLVPWGAAPGEIRYRDEPARSAHPGLYHRSGNGCTGRTRPGFGRLS